MKATRPLGLAPLPPEPVADTQERYHNKIKFMNLFKGGVIMTVSTPQQAKLAEKHGARAILITEGSEKAFEGRHGGHNYRAMDPTEAKRIAGHVVLPSFVRVRYGHEIEAQVMQLHGFTGIFETATLYAPFQRYSIRKHSFNVPFMSDGITCVADALMRIDEGASMLVNHVASSSKPSELHKTYKNIERLYGEIEEFRRRSPVLKSGETISERDKYIEEYLYKTNKVNKPNVKSEGLKIADAPTAMMNLPRPIRKDLLLNVIETGRFPVPFYAHGAITSPEDVAMLRRMGCDGVILSINVFEGRFIDQKLKGAVQASQHWDNNDLLATICEDIGAYVKY